jgi:hypothetical protein
MKKLVTILLLSAALSSAAQSTPGKLSFALPDHRGVLTLDQERWKIIDLSSTPYGNSFGIQARDGDLQFLGFLESSFNFDVTPESCRERTLHNEGLNRTPDVTDRDVIKSDSGTEIATVLIYDRTQTRLRDFLAGMPLNNRRTRARFRAFIASGDLCASLSFQFPLNGPQQDKAHVEAFRAELRTLRFDPQARPTFLDIFTYATVDFETHDRSGAIHDYYLARGRAGETNDKRKWGEIVANQLSVVSATDEHPQKLREALQKAIAHDPGRPGYYLMLARLDADSNDASAARANLQKAFDLRANALPGEIFRDPATDQSFIELKSNPNFWAFVQNLSDQLRKS